MSSTAPVVAPFPHYPSINSPQVATSPYETSDDEITVQMDPTPREHTQSNDQSLPKPSRLSIHTIRAVAVLPWVMMVLYIAAWIAVFTERRSDSYSMIPTIIVLSLSCVWDIWQITAGHTRGTNLKVAAYTAVVFSVLLLIGLIFSLLLGGFISATFVIIAWVFQVSWTVVAFLVAKNKK